MRLSLLVRAYTSVLSSPASCLQVPAMFGVESEVLPGNQTLQYPCIGLWSQHSSVNVSDVQSARILNSAVSIKHYQAARVES